MSDAETNAVVAALIDAIGEQHGCNSDRCACWGAAEVLKCKLGVTVEQLALAAIGAVRRAP